MVSERHAGSDRGALRVAPPDPAAGFWWQTGAWGWTLRCELLDGFSHGWTAGSPHAWALASSDAAGWQQLAEAVGVETRRVVRLKQVHGCRVAVIDRELAANEFEADAVATRARDVLLTVRVADCVPVLIADPTTGAVAAVHAGWRGTRAGIVSRAVERLVEVYGSVPARLRVAIGPSIGPCCYEVGGEVRDAFRASGWGDDVLAGWFAGPADHLDLWRANREQLAAAGVADSSIALSSLCTACHAGWLESYRRDAEAAGRMVAFIRAGEAVR
jgi:YfiH family protein